MLRQSAIKSGLPDKQAAAWQSCNLVFLIETIEASDASSFMTSYVVVVDGGTMNW